MYVYEFVYSLAAAVVILCPRKTRRTTTSSVCIVSFQGFKRYHDHERSIIVLLVRTVPELQWYMYSYTSIVAT